MLLPVSRWMSVSNIPLAARQVPRKLQFHALCATQAREGAEQVEEMSVTLEVYSVQLQVRYGLEPIERCESRFVDGDEHFGAIIVFVNPDVFHSKTQSPQLRELVGQ